MRNAITIKSSSGNFSSLDEEKRVHRDMVTSKKRCLWKSVFLILFLFTAVAGETYAQQDGDGSVVISGETKRWHKVTLTLDGPWSSETGNPNPFLDYRMDVTFKNGNLTYVVPGYFAADGKAANTSAAAGNKWRAHLCPDRTGTWTYTVKFTKGSNVAANGGGVTVAPYNGKSGQFSIEETNKTGRDHRGKGRLKYVEKHYLQYSGTGEYFLKQGADSPENFLAYADFDGKFKSDGYGDKWIKSWSPHVKDWRTGDPTWNGGKGKGIIGAINYLASKEMNAFSFLTMNINGDDRNVFPYLSYFTRDRMDISRLDQWEIVFEHADRMGMHLHFKTQEQENDQLLDGGSLGRLRKLYYRELIARFSHHLALNWNLGEENTNTTNQRKEFAKYFYDNDPYRHNIVLHTYPGSKDEVYNPLLGDASKLTGASLQTRDKLFGEVHGDVNKWVEKSANAGKPWVVPCDEPGHGSTGVMPDVNNPNHDIARRYALWGTLMAGGAGNEWYFGSNYAHSDLSCEDYRSRDYWWDQCGLALKFFQDNDIPFWQMVNDNTKSSTSNDYCFYKENDVYVVYLKNGGSTNLDLLGMDGTFEVKWYDPVIGGGLKNGTVKSISGGGSRNLGNAPYDRNEDWVILIRDTGSGQGGTQPPTVVEAINCGGPAFQAQDGTLYKADTYFSGGKTYKKYHSIAGTNDDKIYQSERYGNFTYAIPLENGDYTVTIKLAEIYFTKAGKRSFDIMVEGQSITEDPMDLFAIAGHDVALDITVTTTVRDGKLDINPVSSIVNNKMISAILVKSAGN